MNYMLLLIFGVCSKILLRTWFGRMIYWFVFFLKAFIDLCICSFICVEFSNLSPCVVRFSTHTLIKSHSLSLTLSLFFYLLFFLKIISSFHERRKLIGSHHCLYLIFSCSCHCSYCYIIIIFSCVNGFG